jgi:hypothetical protein
MNSPFTEQTLPEQSSKDENDKGKSCSKRNLCSQNKGATEKQNIFCKHLSEQLPTFKMS